MSWFNRSRETSEGPKGPAAARRFVLRGTTVSYGGAEVLFSNGSAAKLSGYTGSLKVEGVLSADRALLLASRISFNN